MKAKEKSPDLRSNFPPTYCVSLQNTQEPHPGEFPRKYTRVLFRDELHKNLSILESPSRLKNFSSGNPVQTLRLRHWDVAVRSGYCNNNQMFYTRCVTSWQFPSPRYCAAQHSSFRRNVAVVKNRWQHCVGFNRLEICTPNLPLHRLTRYRSYGLYSFKSMVFIIVEQTIDLLRTKILILYHSRVALGVASIRSIIALMWQLD